MVRAAGRRGQRAAAGAVRPVRGAGRPLPDRLHPARHVRQAPEPAPRVQEDDLTHPGEHGAHALQPVGGELSVRGEKHRHYIK